MDKNIVYSTIQESDNFEDPYTNVNNLIVWNTYFTDKHSRFKKQDWSQKEYFWSWLWEKELLHMISVFKDITTSLVLNAFCIPVTIKEIQNEKITLSIQENLMWLFEGDIIINKYNPIDEDESIDIMKMKNKILYYISFLSDNFTSKKSNKIINIINKEINWAFNNQNREIDIDTLINDLKLLFKDFVYSLSKKEQTFLLVQGLDKNLSINSVLASITYCLYIAIEE
jgi:hypothetical protein